LRRWEELRPQLDARGIQIVTLSTDSPEEIRKGRHAHGVQAIMLSDADLAVTDRFNLRNQSNITPGGIRPMPIPTTFLVDAEGVARWIDQSTDYQVRSNPARVLAAIEANL
jgi:peroxiredoxin